MQAQDTSSDVSLNLPADYVVVGGSDVGERILSINVPTSEIKKFIRLTSQGVKTNQSYTRALRAHNKTNRQVELQALATKASICSAPDAESLQGKVDFEELQSLTDERFYDYDLMRLAGCAVYGYFYGLAESNGDLATLAHIKSSIKNLKRIGAPSVSGNAINADIDGAESVVVVKTPRTEEAEQDLTHELFVGLFGLNRLRRLIPNFALVYGGFKCSKPVINDQKEVLSLCDVTHPDQVPYVLYENVHPAKSMRAYVKTCSAMDYLRLFLQVCNALEVAEHQMDFTHYDLHAENVMAKELKETMNIVYTNRYGETRYMVSDVVGTLIDYGMRKVSYETGEGKRQMGTQNTLTELGMKVGPWIMYDVYKLLMFNAYDLLVLKRNARGEEELIDIINPEVFKVIEVLFRFFNQTDGFLDALVAQRPLYLILPMFDNIASLEVEDFINYVVDQFEMADIMETEARYPLLSCDKCFTFKGAKDATMAKEPKTFFEFYDTATHLARGRTEDYDRLVKSFNYQEARLAYRQSIETDLKHIKTLLAGATIPTIRDNATSAILANKNLVKNLTTSYQTLVDLVSTYEDLELWLKVGHSIAILYQDAELSREIAAARQDLQKADQAIKDLLKRSGANYRVIRKIVESPSWERYRKDFPWYVLASGEIVHLEKRFEYDRNDLFREERLPAALVAAVAPKAVAAVAPPKTTAVAPPKTTAVAPRGVVAAKREAVAPRGVVTTEDFNYVENPTEVGKVQGVPFQRRLKIDRSKTGRMQRIHAGL